jgi:selenocysteine-specific elongation factor
MRSFIVGTAGHIDHGKSALVRALTGTDPDRLKEEKERGITIDLGFAHLPLSEDVVGSFIDVPGHERFVRNMLAGAHGIDAVLLVVAADESVMPQTREHFHICRLLGIPRGLVALTKCDAADADSQALADLETRELVAGSFMEGRPVLRVSARTGEGLPELKRALLDLALEAPARSAGGLLRLPLDRVFTLKGFGTVVTGTVISGTLRAGDDVEVLPAGRRARVRGLQVHGRTVEAVGAGSRAAVNLAGLEVEALARGDVLAHPGTLRATSMLDVELSLLAGERPLADQTRVRVHVASAEALGRVRVLGGGKIEPGASGLAQLRLERPATAGRGDRLVLRSYSPSLTIGGARVLDPLPPKRRVGLRPVTLQLSAAAGDDVRRAAVLMLAEAGTAGIEAPALAARVTVPVSRLRSALEAEDEVVSLAGDPPAFLSREAMTALSSAVLAGLRRFHEANPLKSGMGREELRRRLFARSPAAAFESVLGSLETMGELRVAPDAVALARHRVTLSPGEESAQKLLLQVAEAAGFVGVEVKEVASRTGADPRLLDRVARVLLSGGRLQRVGEALLVHTDHLERLKLEVRRRWPPGSALDVAGFKELTGLSRKYVIPLLEYLDREKVTRRTGTDRVVLAP